MTVLRFMRLFLMNKTIFLFICSFIVAFEKLPEFDSFTWDSLKSNKVSIEYHEKDDIPWCRAYTVTNHSIDKISNVLENKENYPSVFKRITETIVYDNDIIHIKLDMPFPWASRDYIVKYSEFKNHNVKEYSWIYYDKLNI